MAIEERKSFFERVLFRGTALGILGLVIGWVGNVGVLINTGFKLAAGSWIGHEVLRSMRKG